jgi:hypothetical protein
VSAYAGTSIDAAVSGLVDALVVERGVQGSPLYAVAVFDGEPGGQVRPSELVVVGDVLGDEEPATLRAGGGSREERYTVEVTVGARRRTDNTRTVRQRAIAMAQRVERVVYDANNARPPFGDARIRHVLLRGGKDCRQWVLGDERECDVVVRVEVVARIV